MSTVNVARERSLYSSNAERSGPALQRDLSRLREQMSTGKRINRPSDDPDAFAVAEQMKALGSQYARYEESIAAARPWVDRTQATLDQLGELFTQAQEEGIRAANDARSADDRETIAQRLESLRDEVLDQLNAKHDGEHLFAGNQTGTPPFEEGTTTGAIEPVADYDAIDGERTRPIGPDRSLVVNISGRELHKMEEDKVVGGMVVKGQTITGALDDLITAVRNGDTAAMQDALGATEAARDHVVDLGAKAGTTAQRLTAAEEQLQSAGLTAERRRSEAEDADYLETVTALQQTQTRLQAALKATASTLQTSLLDFLR